MDILGERYFGIILVLLHLSHRVAGAGTNNNSNLFSTEVNLNIIPVSSELVNNKLEAHAEETNSTSTSLAAKEGTKSERSRKLPTLPDGRPMQKILQHSFHYTPDIIGGYSQGRSILTRRTPELSRRGGWLMSLPRNFLDTFNLYDPVPVDPGPAPSELPIEEKPKARSASEPFESQILIFSDSK